MSSIIVWLHDCGGVRLSKRAYRLYVDDLSLSDSGGILWSGRVFEPNGVLVCDVWNSGEGAVNEYRWADSLAEFNVEEIARYEFPDQSDATDKLIDLLWVYELESEIFYG